MTGGDAARLVLLAAIWGGSFLFMRIAAPVVGAILTTEIRLVLAAVAMLLYVAIRGIRLELREHWREYSVIGAVNSAIPFLLFSYAALTLPASYSVVLNATSPFFGVLLAAFWLNERLSTSRLAGVAIGIVGVALMTRLGPIPITSAVISAGIACLVAAACYAIAGIYIKRAVRQKNPVATATASQLTGAVMVALALPWASPSGPPTVLVAASLVALALLCSAFAYLLYFRLIERIGPSRALTVTFLSPGFGMLWASLALGESITLPMLAGCGLVVVGTGLVLRAAGSSNPNAQR